MAEEFEREGKYSPVPSHDMWAFGLLLMRLPGGKRPDAHVKAAQSGLITALAYARSLCDPKFPKYYMTQV